MSKRIIIADWAELPKNKVNKPQCTEGIDVLPMNHQQVKEFISEREDMPHPREIRAAKRELKSQARQNRDTSRRERTLAKKSVTAIDFQVGDLVYHVQRPNIFGLVMDINAHHQSVEQGDPIINVMVGIDIQSYRGKSLRKITDDK